MAKKDERPQWILEDEDRDPWDYDDNYVDRGGGPTLAKKDERPQWILEDEDRDPWDYDDNYIDRDGGQTADRDSAAYGNNASGNTTITGGVGRDFVTHIHPTPTMADTVFDHIARTKYDAALKLRRAVLEMRHVISDVRSVSSGEDFQAKLKMLVDSDSALCAALREAEVFFGENVWTACHPLKICARKLQKYIRRHIQSSKHLSTADWEKIYRIVRENDPENDPFTLEVRSAATHTESFLEPYLNPSLKK